MPKPLLVGTGLSSAIGLALIEQLSEWRILALGRTPIAVPEVRHVNCDWGQPGTLWRELLTDEISQAGGQVAGFVHAAGCVYSDTVESTTSWEWEQTLAVNLTAAFQLGQLVSPYLQWGSSVVVVGSVDAWHASEAGPAAAYGAAKAGLAGLMRHWAAEWGKRGIRVNGVAPGALTSGNGPQSEDAAQALTARIALGRLGTPEEIAHVIAFLLSPRASYVTGAWLRVDGGLNVTY